MRQYSVDLAATPPINTDQAMRGREESVPEEAKEAAAQLTASRGGCLVVRAVAARVGGLYIGWRRREVESVRGPWGKLSRPKEWPFGLPSRTRAHMNHARAGRK